MTVGIQGQFTGLIAKSVPVFSSKTLLNTEDVSKTRQAGFKVQLGALCQKGGLPVIIKLEES